MSRNEREHKVGMIEITVTTSHGLLHDFAVDVDYAICIVKS